jgi:cytoplasmic iron level regulating protein YaaA (DUF328/UPF0246 family)
MEVQYTEQKLKIFENILAINNENLLNDLQIYITKQISEYKKVKKTESKNETISFEKWNEQFTDDRNLDDFIPEYGMTLREFRQDIYNAETGNGMTINEFENRVKQWKNKKKVTELL